MADFGSRNMGFFGGSTSGGGGGTSTGVNGLNGTTNIGLGGTLSGNTTILGDSGNYSLIFNDLLFFGVYTTDGWLISNNDSNRLLRIISNISNPTSNYIQLENYKDVTIAGDSCSFNIYYNSIKSLFFSTTEGAFTNFGINIDYDLRTTSLGDIDDEITKTKLVVDDTNGRIYTEFFTSNCGISLSETNATFSANDGTDNIGLNVTSAKEFNAFYGGNIVNGLSLNFDTFVYKFGGFDVPSNQNNIIIDDASQTTTFNANQLIFLGANIEDTNAPAGVGVTYLLITLNGIEYSILCTETNL